MKKKIVLACEKCNSRNYRTNKSVEERLKIKKFCKTCKEHTIHCEEK